MARLPDGPDRIPPPLPGTRRGADPAEPTTNEPVAVGEDGPEVGLSQTGTGEDAIVRRETEI